MVDMNEQANQTDSSTSAAPKLPVRAVTLFSAGVAYLLREGQMPSGAQEASLTFRTTQINDILKSLVLLDDGGVVQAATYPSRDPVGRTLESFAIQVTHNTSRADLLGQVRGAPVSVALINGETLSGRVLGVEQNEETLVNSDRTVTTETLVLLGDDGIVSAPLQTVRSLKLLDARLDGELRGALEALASGSDDARRTVTLRFAGEMERTVRVGYLVEAPLWKVSYRLVLDDEKRRNGNRPTVLTGLGDGGKHDRRGLGGRAVVAGFGAARVVRAGFVPAAVCSAPGRSAGCHRFAVPANARRGFEQRRIEP